MTDQEYNERKALLAEMSQEAKDKYILEHLGAQNGKANEDANDATVTREQFEAMDPGARMRFTQEGGKIATPEPEVVERDPLPDGKIYRSEFFKLAPAERMRFTQEGGRVID